MDSWTLLAILASKIECELSIDYLDAVKSSTFLVISIRADYVTYHYFLMVAKKSQRTYIMRLDPPLIKQTTTRLRQSSV
jgi:hypothetical protein